VTRRGAAAVALAGALVAAPAAGAHVTVLPEKPKLNSEQEFVVRVPVERNVATVAVRVLFPEGVNVSQFAPEAGWTRRVLLTADERPRGVIWQGGRIAPGEYGDFRFLATPRRAGQAVWRAFQTSADGKVKPWTGPPEKPGVESKETGPTQAGPSPAVEVTATPDIPVATGGATSSATRKETSSDAGVWLGVIAIVIALGSALAAGFLWSTRPARLPPDDD